MKELEHWRTMDDRGEIMPWYTRSCLEWLNTLDLFRKRVFEYGGGVSTKWYKGKSCIVKGVDDNPDWAEMAGLVYKTDKEEYLKEINKWDDFDIICIDGVFRDECFFFASKKLREGGFIIIDNWKQESADLAYWPETERLITNLGFKITEYKEPTHTDWTTAVITR